MQAIPGVMTTGAQEAASTPSPKLVKAAQEFEAQLMQELLKPMTTSDGLMGTDDDSDSGSNGALGQFASESLGKALSQHGGLGIANQIIKELSHSGKKSPAIHAAVSGSEQ